MNKLSLGHFLYEANVKFHRSMLGAKPLLTRGSDEFEGLHYLEFGNKNAPPLLYIHGFGDNKDGFLWPSMLLKKFRVIIPDLPGFGDNPQNWQRTYDLDYLKGCLYQFINEIDLNHINIVGNSLGGSLSIKLCLEHPERFKSLILIDSAGFFYPEIPSLLHEYAEGTNLFQVETWQSFEMLLKKLTYRPDRIPRPISKYLFQRIKDQHKWFGKMMDDLIGKDVDVYDPEIIRSRSFNDRIKEINIPTLILWGENDGLFPVEIAHIIHNNINNSKLHIFKKTGHAPQFEHPVKVAVHLHRFIKAANSL